MAGAVHNAGQEFWHPPVAQAQDPLGRMVEVCDHCGTEFLVGSRYCHVCGGARGSEQQTRGIGRYFWPLTLQLHAMRQRLGIGIGALIAFVVGLACALAAVFTGVVYTATTVLDWQAVQVWRIEWLLGAVVALLAGILLKKPKAS